MASKYSPYGLRFGLELTSAVIEQLRTVGSHEELAMLMKSVSADMGFRYYALAHHADLKVDNVHRVNLCHYPDAVLERLLTRRRFRRDPFIRGCIFEDSAFLWSELAAVIIAAIIVAIGAIQPATSSIGHCFLFLAAHGYAGCLCRGG